MLLRRMRKYQHQLQLLPETVIARNAKDGKPRKLDTNTGNRTASCALFSRFNCFYASWKY